MIPRIRPILLALVALLAAMPAAAQTVQGTLQEPGGAPVDRVIVALVDARGTQVARTLTGADGAFTLRAPAAGRYTLRAERIGYAAITSAPFDLRDGETHAERLVSAGAAVMLEGLTVTPAARQCRVRPGAGLATATLWEEARKALNATAYGESARLYRYDVNEWTREIDAGTNGVRREKRVAGAGVAELPFHSLPPAELSRQGYVQRVEGDSVGFWAPDAAVMLSAEFLNDHCLRVVEGGDPALIGLAFEPVRDRRVADIKGTLWLDRRSSELRRVEYGYQGGPPESDDPRVGGVVDYERLPNGPWIVRRWVIRMPMLRPDGRVRLPSNGATGLPGLVVTNEPRVAGLFEAGGEVTAVADGDRPLLAAAAAPVIRGTVWDSIGAAPAAGAQVYLSGTAASATTGPDGSFVLAAPGEGTYTVAFAAAGLGPLGTAGRPASVTVKRGDTATVALGVPGYSQALPLLCNGASMNERGVVMGRLTGPGAASATVTASWFAGRTVSGNPQFTRHMVASRADADGFYAVCGVPTGIPLTVRAQTSTTRGQSEARARAGLAMRADIELHQATAAERMAGVTERRIAAAPGGAAPEPAAGPPPARPGSFGTFELVVQDVAGRPLPLARVRIGQLAAVQTDGDGRARVVAIAPGEYDVRIQDAQQRVLAGTVRIPPAMTRLEIRAGAGTRLTATASHRGGQPAVGEADGGADRDGQRPPPPPQDQRPRDPQPERPKPR